MEKSPVERMNSNHFFIHFIDPIPLNCGQNLDGFEILVFHLIYSPLTKKENGLP